MFVGLDPGDVVADGGDLPSLEACGRDQHGEVGLAAGGGEGPGDVGLFCLACGVRGRFDAEDEHVLGHPAFVAGDIGGDAQGEALLAQQGVAAIAGAIGPDFARLGELDNVLFGIAGPGDILVSPGASGAPTECRHGTTRLSSLSISAKTGAPTRAMMRILTTA